MASSKAKKIRKSLVRQGKYDPSGQRGNWNGINPITKKTPSIKEKIKKSERKYGRKSLDNDGYCA